MNFPAFGFSSPFEDIERLRRQIDQIFDQINERPGYMRTRVGVFPLINLTENRDTYFIRAEIPGIDPEDLDIQATGRNISITGERKMETDENAKYHRREREFGKFSRMFALPGDIDHERINANLKNGILTITIPKAETAKPKQIKIN